MASGTRGRKRKERRERQEELDGREAVQDDVHADAHNTPNNSNRFERLRQEEGGRDENANMTNSESSMSGQVQEAVENSDLHELVRNLAKESQATSKQVAGVLEQLSSVLGGLTIGQSSSASRREESLTRDKTLPHFKGKDLSIPKYAGSHESKTPFDFLSELEKYRLAAGLTELQMFVSIIPVALSGQAYEWFQFIKDSITSWNQFCQLLRKEFQPPGYDEELRRELEERTQGPHETLSHYIRIINGFYERIDPRTPESIRISRILRQMHPSYRQKILRTGVEFVSMRQLADEALKVQEDIWYEKEYREPKQFSVVEPSLAYKVPDSQKQKFGQFSSNSGSGSDLHRSSFDPFRHFHSVQPPSQNSRFQNNNNSLGLVRNSQSFEQRRSSDRAQEQASRTMSNGFRNVSWANPVSIDSNANSMQASRRHSESESGPRIDSSFLSSQYKAHSLEEVSTSSQRNTACFICGVEGHFSRSCPNRQTQSSGNGPNLSRM